MIKLHAKYKEVLRIMESFINLEDISILSESNNSFDMSEAELLISYELEGTDYPTFVVSLADKKHGKVAIIAHVAKETGIISIPISPILENKIPLKITKQ
jgi:hypothetical protein